MDIGLVNDSFFPDVDWSVIGYITIIHSELWLSDENASEFVRCFMFLSEFKNDSRKNHAKIDK